jgi:hypothetical protein
MQHAGQLWIQVPGVQLIAFVAALLQERRQVECRHERRLSDLPNLVCGLIEGQATGPSPACNG